MFLPLLASPEVGEVSRSDGEVRDATAWRRHNMASLRGMRAGRGALAKINENKNEK